MRSRRDDGFATPVEMMGLVLFGLLATMFLGYLGRLHAAGVEVTSTARSAARAASLVSGPNAATAEATHVVATSPLVRRCGGGTRTRVVWAPSSLGTWQGGSVTVTVVCTIRNRSLSGVWAPGMRTVSMSDTQPIDRYHR